MIKQNYRLLVEDDGAKLYSYKYKYHRLNGPASIWPDGSRSYWVNNELKSKQDHRLNGSVIIFPDGYQKND